MKKQLSILLAMALMPLAFCSKFKVIVFDAADTLIKVDYNFPDLLKVVAQENDLPEKSDNELRTAFVAAMQETPGFKEMHNALYDQEKLKGHMGTLMVFMTHWCNKLGYSVEKHHVQQLLQQMMTIGKSSHSPFFSLYDDTIITLESLKDNEYRIALLSNWDASLRLQLARFDLVKFFGKNIFISGEMGVEKPNKEIFENACKQLGVEPNEILYIGDTPEDDVLGAKNAKIACIWINRGKKIAPELADYPLGNITQLSELDFILTK